MEGGKIAVDGPPSAVLDNPDNIRLREFLHHVR
jgi:glutamine transport system ATP-binding protein